MNIILFSIVGLSLSLLSACDIVDNQEISDPTDQGVVDPPVKNRPFELINRSHKVLIALIDNGVDYNHPLLLKHLHFMPEMRMNKLRLGMDFVGKDLLPSPYLARTSRYDKSLGSDDIASAKKRSLALGRFLAAFPEFKGFMDSKRHLEQENSAQIFRGTHLAALMVYDRPDVGLLPYRILPNNVREADWMGIKYDYFGETISKMILAIDKAVSDGAKIVNIPFSEMVAKPKDDEDSDNYNEMLQLKTKIEQTVRRYPQVLFIISAGDVGAWVDGDSRFVIPCSIDVPNILCVGSLRTDQQLPTADTNVVLNKLDFVFAWGESVVSASPQGYCNYDFDGLFDDKDWIPAATYPKASAEIRENCSHLGMAVMDGTQTSASLVTRLAAIQVLETPGLSGSEIIRKLLSKAEKGNWGQLPINRLKIEKPSWYTALRLRASPWVLVTKKRN